MNCLLVSMDGLRPSSVSTSIGILLVATKRFFLWTEVFFLGIQSGYDVDSCWPRIQIDNYRVCFGVDPVAEGFEVVVTRTEAVEADSDFPIRVMVPIGNASCGSRKGKLFVAGAVRECDYVVFFAFKIGVKDHRRSGSVL